MFNKVYEKVLEYLKGNYKFYLTLLVVFFICIIELPFYVETPGGLIDVSKRIEVETDKEIEGSFNLPYVLEFRATLPTLIFGYLNPNATVHRKRDHIPENETIEDIQFRDRLLLEESSQNAIIASFNKANRYVAITNRKVYVIFIDINSNTDLKIGDQILKINDNYIYSKEDVHSMLIEYQAGDEINFLVYNEGEKTRKAIMFEDNGRALVGIVLAETKDIDTNEDIKFSFNRSESGPSGGLMLTLAIYNHLIEQDITKGLKIVGTGSIDERGNVGIVGGIEHKIRTAARRRADLFFIPSGENYETARRIINENNLDLKLISVDTIDEAIEYLLNL